jgi:hypothetical protein
MFWFLETTAGHLADTGAEHASTGCRCEFLKIKLQAKCKQSGF